MIHYEVTCAELAIVEPTDDELEAALPTLLAGYNDPQNAPRLGHTSALSAADVREHYAALRATGRAFLLCRDGIVVGDADLRAFSGQTAEFAFLIADPAVQGQGLGTRFARLVHALAFGPLGRARVYAAVLPDNTASRRVFGKLGYTVDNTVDAQDYGDPGDIVLQLERDVFLRHNADAIAQIRIAAR